MLRVKDTNNFMFPFGGEILYPSLVFVGLFVHEANKLERQNIGEDEF